MQDSKPYLGTGFSMDPKTVREVAIDLYGFKEALRPHIKVLYAGIGAILTVVIAAVGGGLAIYAQIGDLKASLAGLTRDVANGRERLDRIDGHVSDILKRQGETAAVLGRIERHLAAAPAERGPFAPVVLSAFEYQLVGSWLKVPSQQKGPARVELGDILGGAKPIPGDLAAKIPKLAGVKFDHDPNGWVILVGAGDRVISILPPTN